MMLKGLGLGFVFLFMACEETQSKKSCPNLKPQDPVQQENPQVLPQVLKEEKKKDFKPEESQEEIKNRTDPSTSEDETEDTSSHFSDEELPSFSMFQDQCEPEETGASFFLLELLREKNLNTPPPLNAHEEKEEKEEKDFNRPFFLSR